MSSFTRSPISSRRASGLAGLLALLLVLCLAGARAEAMPVPGATPSVWSDQGDYRPGAAVKLAGSGWGAGEAVHIRVNDDAGSTWSRDVDVTADADGAIADSFSLPDWFVAQYSVTATGTSGAVATWSFTDGNVSFALATTDTAVPAGSSLSWTVNWDHFKNSTTCASSARDGSGSTSYIGNTVVQNNTEPSVGNNQSAQPTGATANGYVFDYWSTAPNSTVHASTCVVQSSGTSFLYAHFKSAIKDTSLAVGGAAGTYGGTASLSATLTSGGAGVNGKTIAFSVNGTNVGTATTGSDGKATLSANLAGIAAGTYAGGVRASFTADPGYAAAGGSGSLTVARRPVTGSFTAADKVYDGTAAAAITGRSLSGAVSGDDVGLSGGTATFGDENVGQNKAVNGTGFALAGAAKDNYTLGSVSGTTASIAPKEITGSFTAADKIYDGTRDATISDRSLSGAVTGDTVSLTGGSASFDTKNVGRDKDVSGSGFGLAGDDKGNYVLKSSDLATTASITAKPVTGHFAAADKIYDGDTDATITDRSLTGVVGTEDVTLTGGSASFATKNVGRDKDVNGGGFALGGDDKGNYTLGSSSLATTASITAKSLTGHFTATAKVYDGNRDATISGRSLDGVVGDEDVSLTGGSASFDTKDAGKAKTVSGGGFDLDGADKGNYVLGSVADTTASITPREITGSYTAADKVYDGTTDAAITSRSLGGAVDGDKVSLVGGSAQFATKDAGRDKAVSGTGFGLAGDDKDDYTLGSVADTTASIAPKEITGSFTAADKVYDGTTDAAITSRSLTGNVDGDKVALSGGAAQFDTKDVGRDKAVGGTGFELAGDDKGNYTLRSSSLVTTASITAKPLTGQFTAADKAYDGTRDATITGRSLTGVRDGETVTLTGGSASFDTKDAGTGKTVSGDGFGLAGDDKGNYALAGVADAKADIAPKQLTGHFVAAGKVYDGTRDATITGRSLDGVVGTEDVTLTGGSATFDTKDAGEDKTVTGNGFALGGADKGNYALGSTADTTASIAPKEITGSFTAADKVYDGTTDAAITGRSLTGTIDGDQVSLTGGAGQFDTKNVGTGKDVTGNGFALAGDDKGDYTLKSGALATKANITAKDLTGHFTAADKVYDGNRDATITGAALGSGVVDGDQVGLDASAAKAQFGTKDAGQAKTVTGSGFSLTGAGEGNYTLSMDTASASVTPKPITGAFTAADKVYDGTAGATITGRSLSGVVTGDTVALSGGTAAFASKSAAQGKAVSGDGFALAGADKDDYTLASVSGTTATITPKSVSGSFTAADKVYDGSAAATITDRSLSGRIAGDDVSLSGGTATFADANVGQSKPVTGGGFTLAGADKDNYSLASVDGTTASITYAPATATCLGAAGHTILQPINVDGTSVFKQGSTVPAKFRVCDAKGNSIGIAGVVTSFRLTQTISGLLSTAVNELVDSTSPGTDFRWSATDQQWVFNMSTKNLTAGRTYIYTVTLNDGTSFQFRFGLK